MTDPEDTFGKERMNNEGCPHFDEPTDAPPVMTPPSGHATLPIPRDEHHTSAVPVALRAMVDGSHT